MSTTHTMYIYKTDRRTKTGERLVSCTVWHNRDAATMGREARELQYTLYPIVAGYRIECIQTGVQE